MHVSVMKHLPRIIRQADKLWFPIAGFVKNILVKEGDYVTIGQPLVSVTQNRRLFLRAEVSEKYYPSLRTIGSANFKTPYDDKVYELKGLNGRLCHSANQPATIHFTCRSLSNSTIRVTSFRVRSLKYTCCRHLWKT